MAGYPVLNLQNFQRANAQAGVEEGKQAGSLYEKAFNKAGQVVDDITGQRQTEFKEGSVENTRALANELNALREGGDINAVPDAATYLANAQNRFGKQFDANAINKQVQGLKSGINTDLTQQFELENLRNQQAQQRAVEGADYSGLAVPDTQTLDTMQGRLNQRQSMIQGLVDQGLSLPKATAEVQQQFDAVGLDNGAIISRLKQSGMGDSDVQKMGASYGIGDAEINAGITAFENLPERKATRAAEATRVKRAADFADFTQKADWTNNTKLKDPALVIKNIRTMVPDNALLNFSDEDWRLGATDIGEQLQNSDLSPQAVWNVVMSHGLDGNDFDRDNFKVGIRQAEVDFLTQ